MPNKALASLTLLLVSFQKLYLELSIFFFLLRVKLLNIATSKSNESSERYHSSKEDCGTEKGTMPFTFLYLLAWYYLVFRAEPIAS